MGSLALLFLCGFLVIFGLSKLIPIAIPDWVVGVLSLGAGVLLFIGG